MKKNFKGKVLKGLFWSSIDSFSVQGVQFLVTIIMARILVPADYGLVGMLSVFIAVSQTVVDSGFAQALIRKLDRSEIDNSTVFYFNVAVGLFLYVVLFLSSGYISMFYEEQRLSSLLKVLGLVVVFNSLTIVHRANLSVKLDFKTLTKVSFISVVLSALVGLYMSFSGYGVWSLVAQQVSNSLANAVMMWCLSTWRPRLLYSWKSFKELFSFGSKMLVSGLLDTVYRNVYVLVIGKFFSSASLGHYSRAKHFADFPSSNITGILQRVTYPALCEIQNDDERLKDVYRRFLRLSAFVVFPMMLGLASVSRPLILCLLKEQWLFCSSLLSILCFSMMWYPIHAINLNLLQVKGRSDLFLRLEIIKKIIGVGILCVTIPMGLVAMCVGSVVSSLLCLIVNTYYTGRLIDVGFVRQLMDLLPILLISLVMGSAVYCVSNIVYLPSFCGLVLGIVVGVVLFYMMARMFEFKELDEIKSLLK